MSVFSRSAFFAVASLASVAVLGCSGDDDDGAASGPSEQAGAGRLTVPEPSQDRRAERRAMAAGRRACRGERAAVVRDRFLARTRRAVRAGRARVAPGYLKEAVEAGDEVTAPVAAFVFAAGLPTERRRDAHHGCLYEIAKAGGR